MNVSSLMGKHISVLTDKSSAVQGQALRQALELMGATTHPTVSKNNDKIVMLIYSSDQSCKTLMQQARKLKSRYPFVAIPAYEFPLDNQQLSVPKSADCISVPFELNAILETLLHLTPRPKVKPPLTSAKIKRLLSFCFFCILSVLPIGFCVHLYRTNAFDEVPQSAPSKLSDTQAYTTSHPVIFGHNNSIQFQKNEPQSESANQRKVINIVSLILVIFVYTILLLTALIAFVGSCRRCRQLKGIAKIKHYLDTFDDEEFEHCGDDRLQKERRNEAYKRRVKAQNQLLDFYLEESER